MACPKQYAFRLEGRPQTSLPLIMTRGKYAHAFYEKYTKTCLETNSMQNLAILDDLKRSVFKEACQDSARDGEPFLSPREWDEVFEMLCRPWAERTALPVDNISGVEVKWARRDDGMETGFNAKTAWMRGVLDRVEHMGKGVVRVVDYKTGYGGHGDTMQSDIYAWAMLQDEDTKEVTVVFEHTAMDKREVYEYTKMDLPVLDKQLRVMAEAILSCEEYNPRPGVACLECPYAYCCDKKADIHEAIEDLDGAKQAVETIALLERDLKAVKAALLRWYEANGPITHNGITWNKWVSQPEGFYDAKMFVHVAANAGVDPWKYVSVNNTTTKKFRKIFPDLVTQGKATERWMGKKVGEEEE